MLELRASDRGLLIPRLALQSKTAPIAAPAVGLLVWNTATSGAYPQPGFYYWSGSDWKKLLLQDGAAAVSALSINGVSVEVTAAQVNALRHIEGNVQSRLETLEANAGAVGVDLTVVNAELDDLQLQISANDEDIEVLFTTATTHASGLSTHAGQIATLQSVDANLQGRVSTNETDIATNAAAIVSNDADISGLQTAVTTAQTDVDGFEDTLKDLTAEEVAQLKNLDVTTVSAEQWGYLGATDQSLATTDAVRFAGVTSTGGLAFEGASVDDFQLALEAINPTADRSILFPDADGTVALLSDLSDVDGALQTRLDGQQLELDDLQVQTSANDDDIAVLFTTATTHASGLSTHAGQIATLQSVDANLQGRVSTNETDIAANAAAIVSNDADIAGLQTAVTVAQADVDGFEDTLKDLTAEEVAQLKNLDATAVSAEQWGYLGATDQSVATTDAVRFAGITTTGALAFEGASVDDFQLTLEASDPTAARSILFPDADGTLALLSDLGDLDGALQTRLDDHQLELDDLQVQMSANDEDIAVLFTTATTHASGLSTHAGQIATLQSVDANLEGRVSTNETDITANTAAIVGNDADIAGLQTAVTVAQTDVDGFEDTLKDLTADEVAQLKNLDVTTVSAEQWGYLGATDQSLATTDAVRFAGVTSTGGLALEGVTVDDFQLTLEASDPTAARSILFPDADGTVALLSDLGDLDGVLQTRLDGQQLELDDLQVQISANDDDIAVLFTTATTHASGLSTHAGQIATLQSVDANLESRVSTNETDIAANAAAIAANGAEISVLHAKDVDLQMQSDQQAGDITTLQIVDAGLQSQILEAATDITILDAAVTAAQTDVDGFEDTLKDLTAEEVAQLKNLDATTVSGEQWGYLGGTDQSLATTDAVRFAGVTSTAGLALEGATADDFQLTLEASDPTAARSILFPDADGTVALLSDISDVGFELQNQIDNQSLVIQTFEAVATNLKTQITANDGEILALQTTIAEQGSHIIQNAGNISELEITATVQATAISGLNARTIVTGTGLTGGGDLSANRTLAIADAGVGTAQLADDAVSDAKVVNTLTIDGGTVDDTPIGGIKPASVVATDLAAISSVRLPDEGAAPAPVVGMIRYNSAGYLEFYHEVATDVFAWVPVNSYAP